MQRLSGEQMNLEQLVCSLDLAKRLKELGVKQESLYFWVDDLGLSPPYVWQTNNFPQKIKNYMCSAFNICELGDLLPDNLCIDKAHPNLFIAKGTQKEGSWTIGYSTMSDAITTFYTEENLANAMARLLIHLIENKIMMIKPSLEWKALQFVINEDHRG